MIDNKENLNFILPTLLIGFSSTGGLGNKPSYFKKNLSYIMNKKIIILTCVFLYKYCTLINYVSTFIRCTATEWNSLPADLVPERMNRHYRNIHHRHLPTGDMEVKRTLIFFFFNASASQRPLLLYNVLTDIRVYMVKL